jgi:holo-[acyl-carrier protein] synthase
MQWKSSETDYWLHDRSRRPQTKSTRISMLAVGIDLIEVARVQESISTFGQRFLSRIFTENEQRYCDGRAQSFAARFALKEAVAKALGTGIGDVRWLDIEIINNADGRPLLVLHGKARQIASDLGLEEWSISLSHTKLQAIGMAVAMNVSSESKQSA